MIQAWQPPRKWGPPEQPPPTPSLHSVMGSHFGQTHSEWVSLWRLLLGVRPVAMPVGGLNMSWMPGVVHRWQLFMCIALTLGSATLMAYRAPVPCGALPGRQGGVDRLSPRPMYWIHYRPWAREPPGQRCWEQAGATARASWSCCPLYPVQAHGAPAHSELVPSWHPETGDPERSGVSQS